jgi:aldehyde:ferredoxin oxidoreductase
MNGLGLCMFTMLTGRLPWLELVNAVTGWDLDERDLLRAGERIQNLRAAFNWREGLRPADFTAHPRMMGEGDGNLAAGPLKGVRVRAAGPARRLLRPHALGPDHRPAQPGPRRRAGH